MEIVRREVIETLAKSFFAQTCKFTGKFATSVSSILLMAPRLSFSPTIPAETYIIRRVSS